MIANVPINPAKKVTKKVLDRTTYRMSSLKAPARTVGNAKGVRVANIQALVENAEQEGN